MREIDKRESRIEKLEHECEKRVQAVVREADRLVDVKQGTRHEVKKNRSADRPKRNTGKYSVKSESDLLSENCVSHESNKVSQERRALSLT